MSLSNVNSPSDIADRRASKARGRNSTHPGNPRQPRAGGKFVKASGFSAALDAMERKVSGTANFEPVDLVAQHQADEADDIRAVMKARHYVPAPDKPFPGEMMRRAIVLVLAAVAVVAVINFARL